MGHLRQRGRDDGGIQILHEERSRDYVRQPASGRGCWQRTVAHREFQVERRRHLERRAIVEIDAFAAPIDPARHSDYIRLCARYALGSALTRLALSRNT